MSDSELVDVVDEQDRVIGQATKKEAHAKGLRHRIVHVLVFNSKGDILLQTRAAHKLGGGLLDVSVGGHVLVGESYEAAALREAMEELGISCTLGSSHETWESTHPALVHVARISHVGRCFTTVCEGPFRTGEETAELRFYTLMELRRLIRERPDRFTPASLESLRPHLG